MSRVPTAENPSSDPNHLPSDFQIYISDTYQYPDEKNAAFVLKRFKNAELKPSELFKGDEKNLLLAKSGFDVLFFKFDCLEGCKFKLEITFPQEDDNQRRKNNLIAAMDN